MKMKFPKGLLLFILILIIVVVIELFKIQMEYSIYFIRTFGIIAAYGLMLGFALLYGGIKLIIKYFKNRRR